MLNLFRDYEQASGQVISKDKFKFFLGDAMHNRSVRISKILGFSDGHLPINYLGVPIFKGKPKTSHLLPIADNIKTKLSNWKGSTLSIMGRVQLLKSVIFRMMVYSFKIYYWPLNLLKTINAWLRNFVWYGCISSRKLCIVAWSKVCKSTLDGGLGLRSLNTINKAALLKLGWELVSSNLQCASLVRSRVFRSGKPVIQHIKSSI